jgi:hypothetical protein
VNLGLGQQAPQRQENQRDGQNQYDEKQVSMVGPRIPPSQPANLPHRFHEIDQGERVDENDIQIDECNNPFGIAIMNFEMPANFYFAVQIDPYDENTDPKTISRYSNKIWFSSLPAGSITGWKALKDKFISNFTSSKQ